MLVNFTVVITFVSVGLFIYMVTTSYISQKWSFSSIYSRVVLGEMDASLSSAPLNEDSNRRQAPIRKKIVKNKYEDYWGEDSEDNSLRNFPTRASTMGFGLGYGTGLETGRGDTGFGLSTFGLGTGQGISSKPKGTISYEDYWDENIDFSIRSHDSFGLR